MITIGSLASLMRTKRYIKEKLSTSENLGHVFFFVFFKLLEAIL